MLRGLTDYQPIPVVLAPRSSPVWRIQETPGHYGYPDTGGGSLTGLTTDYWSHFYFDLQIIRRMYKLDEKHHNWDYNFAWILHNLGNQILYILPDFPVYVRTSWVSKYFLHQRKSIPKLFFFPKDFFFCLVKLSTASRVVERLMIEMRDKITSLGALVVVCPVCFRNFGNFGFKNVKKMKMKIKS